MAAEKLYRTAKLIGYNQFDDIVYSVRLSLDDYYDGEHPWDSTAGVIQLAMVKMVGTLYGADGKIYQEFESAFSSETGEYIGGWSKHDDGTTRSDGIYTDA